MKIMTENIDGSPLTELTPDDDDGDPDQRLLIDCVHQAGDWLPSEQTENLLAAIAEAVPTVLSMNDQRLAVALALADDSIVRRLNADFRGQDKPTNVLSFPAASANGPEASRRFVGDIALAYETVRDEALHKGIPMRDHMAHLIVHGLLHLLGFDHAADAEADIMERTETRVLKRLAIPDPYQSLNNEEVFDRPA